VAIDFVSARGLVSLQKPLQTRVKTGEFGVQNEMALDFINIIKWIGGFSVLAKFRLQMSGFSREQK
jgi:hypothetical protein